MNQQRLQDSSEESIVKAACRAVCPPVLWRLGSCLRNISRRERRMECGADLGVPAPCLGGQHDHLYWDDKFADVLDEWGEGTVWTEIRLLMAGRQGTVLDVACGTGRTMEKLFAFEELAVVGCDLSEYLVNRARQRGISTSRLQVCDASALPYAAGGFDYVYTIGSLEHIEADALPRAVSECARVARQCVFHMVPVSRSRRNEGWMTTRQSFHNNSEKWWIDLCSRYHSRVQILESRWQDDISLGRWLICNCKE